MKTLEERQKLEARTRTAVLLADDQRRISLKHAINAGRLLTELKDATEHGEWLPTLERIGVGERVAQRYMRIYRILRRRTKSVSESDLPPTIRAAEKSIATPKPVIEPDPKPIITDQIAPAVMCDGLPPVTLAEVAAQVAAESEPWATFDGHEPIQDKRGVTLDVSCAASGCGWRCGYASKLDTAGNERDARAGFKRHVRKLEIAAEGKPRPLSAERRRNQDAWRETWAGLGITEAQIAEMVRADQDYQTHVVSLIEKITNAFPVEQRPVTVYWLSKFRHDASVIEDVKFLFETGGVGNGIKSSGQGG
jgi:hypothetical protein